MPHLSLSSDDVAARFAGVGLALGFLARGLAGGFSAAEHQGKTQKGLNSKPHIEVSCMFYSVCICDHVANVGAGKLFTFSHELRQMICTLTFGLITILPNDVWADGFIIPLNPDLSCGSGVPSAGEGRSLSQTWSQTGTPTQTRQAGACHPQTRCSPPSSLTETLSLSLS